MHVVAARVHTPGRLRGKRDAALFGDGQRIDVGAQTDDTSRAAAVNDAYNAGATDTRANGDVERAEISLDFTRRLAFFEGELRDLMKLAAQLHQSGCNALDQQVHV